MNILLSAPWLRSRMKRDLDKIDDAVLALVYLNSFTEGKGPLAVTRAWKSHDWDALDRLHHKGFTGDAKNKNKSIVFTAQGRAKPEPIIPRPVLRLIPFTPEGTISVI